MKLAMIVPSLAGRVSVELKLFTRRGACSAKPLTHPPFPLIKQLAIPLGNHKTVAKWLDISQRARGTVRRYASFTLLP